MNVFDDREKAFEAKYHMDEEIAFKVNARRDKLLGLWVAQLMGMSGAEAEAYARSVLEADFQAPGHAAMLKKLSADLAAKGVAMPEDKLQHEMDRLLTAAKQQIMDEAGK